MPDLLRWVRLLGGPGRAATAAVGVLHCRNGTLRRALIGLGRLEDPRVQAAIGWAARTIARGGPLVCLGHQRAAFG